MHCFLYCFFFYILYYTCVTQHTGPTALCPIRRTNIKRCSHKKLCTKISSFEFPYVVLLFSFLVLSLVPRRYQDSQICIPVGTFVVLLFSFLVLSFVPRRYQDSQICIPAGTSFVLSIVPVLNFPIDFVHNISCGASRSLEFPYWVLLFSLVCLFLVSEGTECGYPGYRILELRGGLCKCCT